jgi:hypothetical protein
MRKTMLHHRYPSLFQGVNFRIECPTGSGELKGTGRNYMKTWPKHPVIYEINPITTAL